MSAPAVKALLTGVLSSEGVLAALCLRDGWSRVCSPECMPPVCVPGSRGSSRSPSLFLAVLFGMHIFVLRQENSLCGLASG